MLIFHGFFPMIVCFPPFKNMCLPVVFAAQRRHLERRESELFKAAKSQQWIPLQGGPQVRLEVVVTWGIAPIDGRK